MAGKITLALHHPLVVHRLKFKNYLKIEIQEITLFIILTRNKTPEELYLEQPSSNYPDLLPEMPRYCYPVKIYLFFSSYLEKRLKFKALKVLKDLQSFQ